MAGIGVLGGYGMDPGEWMSNKQRAFQADALMNQLQISKGNNETQKYGIDKGLQGQKYTTDANLRINDLNNATQRYGIDSGSAAQRYGYDTNLKSALGVADRNQAAQQYSADSAERANKYSSDNSLAATLGSAGISASSQNYASDQAYKSSVYGSDASRAASDHQADQSLAAALANVGGQNERFNKGLDWSKDKFGQIFGYIQGQAGGLGGSASPSELAIDYGSAPQIDTSPVFTQRQIQENVNNAVGLVDQRTAAQGANLARNGAARGIGSRSSPLIQALTQQNQAIGNGAAADSELNFRTNAAQKNADQRLAAQQAASQGWNQQQALKLQSQKNVLDFNSALLSALSGLGSIA